MKQKVPPEFFMPYRQDKEPGGMHVYVRISGDIAQVAPAITAVVKRLDPTASTLPSVASFRDLREPDHCAAGSSRSATVVVWYDA